MRVQLGTNAGGTRELFVVILLIRNAQHWTRLILETAHTIRQPGHEMLSDTNLTGPYGLYAVNDGRKVSMAQACCRTSITLLFLDEFRKLFLK